jgi:hypothetical protein
MNIIYPRSSSLKYDLIVYIEADFCVSDIIYNVHDYSVLYNDTVGPIICEDWRSTRMWKAPALPDNATNWMI